MGLFTSLLGKKAIVEKDDISGTFIAYYKGKEDIIGEGETKNEALKNNQTLGALFAGISQQWLKSTLMQRFRDYFYASLTSLQI